MALNSKNTQQFIYLPLGYAFLILAYCGVILPGVPTIPFGLLAFFCFSKSSNKLHTWMMRQKVFQKMLSNKNRKKSLFVIKLVIIAQLWISVLVAELLFLMPLYLRIVIILFGIGLSYTTHKLVE